MNCNQCEDLIGDFLDGTLGREDQALLGAHLEECLTCMGMSDEMRAIITLAHAEREREIAPPDARTLWLHIRDVIEIEEYPAVARESAPVRRSANAGTGEGFWSNLWNKRWEMSLPQMTAALASLVIVVALVTALGLQGVRGIAGDGARESSLVGGANNSSGQTVAVARPIVDDLLRQQRADMEYLNQRVAQRQTRWTPQMRETFDRSIAAVDQAVNDSINDLRANPGDQVSGEMLTVALDNKAELLRQFSEF